MASLSNAPDGKIFHALLSSVDPKTNLFTPKIFIWGFELSGMSDAKRPQYPIPESSGDEHPIVYSKEDATTIYLAQID